MAETEPAIVETDKPDKPVRTAQQKADRKERKAKKAERKSATQDTEATEDDKFYCPGCGRRFPYLTECTGMTLSAPHPAIRVVSTDELAEGADPSKHTPAPSTENLGV